MPQKTKKTSSSQHKAHIKRLHKQRLIWFIVLAVGLIVIQIIYHVQQINAVRVKAYATSISIGDLAAITNQQRANNGKSALHLNGALNAGAQAKANDMIAKNYWAHVSPDGTQPWYFFTAYGYNYSSAGENLAYGFDTSAATIDGWMNSPGHKANLLGPYQDMGFGIASGDNYQGGENTVVVAFYGVPSSPPPPPVAKAAPPAPKPTPAPAPAPTPAPTPAPAPTPEPVTEQPKPTEAAKPVETPPKQEPAQVNTLATVLHGTASWATVASIGLISATSIGFAATHRELVRRSWSVSKHFVLVHPALDAAVIVATLAIILTSTAGFIK